MMRISNYIPAILALAVGCLFSFGTAILAVGVVEERSGEDVTRVLGLNGQSWVQVDVDGLQVSLSGAAPDESTRFNALTIAGTVVDASRVVDMMDVIISDPIAPPRFSVEILRNDDGISVIGLIPASMDRETVIGAIREIAKDTEVVDLLEEASFDPPEGWDNAVSYGMEALATLPRSKISISANRVELKAISDSSAQKSTLETELARKAPDGLHVAIDISAPRPVITPYTLRFLLDAEGARFDACSTDTDVGREKILTSARAAGLEGKATCSLGLGIPSPNWDDAVVIAIEKLNELGGGSVTFSDADVTIVALDTTPQSKFDNVVGQLKSELPDVFSLHAVLPEPVEIDGTGEGAGPPEFVATRSPEGLVQLRGRVSDERTRIATESYARAQFGSTAVNGAMLVDPELPNGWSTRVLASLESLSYLHNGSVVTQPDVVVIRGSTGDPDARSEITRILSEKLGQSENYRITVLYEKKLDPTANIPSPEECVQQINLVLGVRQITFAPSSGDIDAEAKETIDAIADIMEKCSDVPMEIGGHTDSQGREIMNQELSQSRAEAVVEALMSRRILTSNLTAVGYGETLPIADNGSETGRESNRRIEFKLIVPDEPETGEPATPEIDTKTETESTNE